MKKILIPFILLTSCEIFCLQRIRRSSFKLVKKLHRYNQFLANLSPNRKRYFSIKLIDQSKDNHFVYDKKIELKKNIEKEVYSKIVSNLPIVCVDIFLINNETNEFLLLKRNNEPAKDEFWVPGGRLYKGESFFDCAKRKCYEEIGIEAEPKEIIETYSTTFRNSAWNSTTHTINIAIYAICENKNGKLDSNHIDYKWVPIDKIQDNEYIESIRKKFLESRE